MPGRVCLWRYRARARNYPGFHLSADPDGCTQLLALLRNLAKARTPQIGTIVLDRVTPADLSIPNNGDDVASYTRWELVVDPGFDPEHLRFSVINDRVRTELSTVQVESVAAGVQDICEGRGDYGIGDDDDHMLTFWWQ